MTSGKTVLLLASESPRRKALLDSIGVRFRQMPAHIDERPALGELPEHYVRRMALSKARLVAAKGDAGQVTLAGDTAVVLDQVIFGKAADPDDAMSMLSRLSGRTHHVLSAIAVVQGAVEKCELVDTQVTFRQIDAGEIRRYCDTGEYVGKAGAYAIQGLAGVFVAGLQGSYSAVVGLPLFQTAQMLAEFGISVWNRDASHE